MNSHKAKFLGKVVVKKWADKLEDEPQLIDVDADYELIHEENINNPPFGVGDEVFIHTHNKKSKIKEVIRSTDNSYIYYTNFVIKENSLSEEELSKSLLQAQKNINERKKHWGERKKIKEKEQEYQNKIKQYNKLSWFKKIFTKKPTKEISTDDIFYS